LFNDSTVHNNSNYTWNSIANLLYLESPVGVGFSVGNTTYNDSITTQDQYAALNLFFNGFPEYKSSPFYISGESYAGVYVPNLAAYILNNTSSGINLKGILVGNPVTNYTYLNTGFPTVQFFFYHYLIPTDTYTGYAANCKGPQESQIEPVCVFYTNIINSLTSNINPYGIYNYCYYSPSDPASIHSVKVQQRSPWYKFGYDGNSPCTTTNGAWILLNNATVQTQLHVGPVTWNDCNDDIFDVYDSYQNGSLDAYAYLLTQNISIWIFSGDTDSVVPFTDTLYWINNFNLPITEQWRAWAVNEQIGGFTQAYQGLRFVSVRGAGHMVPTDKPASAFVLFQTFLANGSLPDPPVYGKVKTSL
jgi:serine carboxypeptidase-like clade 2